MALVPWDVHLKAGQLAVYAAALTTMLLTTVRRRPRRPVQAAPAPPAPRHLRAHVVPTHPAGGDSEHTAAVTDLRTCVSELASDLAKRYGGEL
ncbi:hypothetical protein OKJ48_31475 [Streptomyces kunmingensis]|uniref:Uncharacterized protein n=1 Tax=Streptomyces kunmingensis TaxID=68225 RepID=A0ABU6CJ28_9ACTN|nr:hypothetical protein [Streptomyces kunmingensis]MEB3964719.1 hypothetical protein [Streptomyces kunmingensis]